MMYLIEVAIAVVSLAAGYGLGIWHHPLGKKHVRLQYELNRDWSNPTSAETKMLIKRIKSL